MKISILRLAGLTCIFTLALWAGVAPVFAQETTEEKQTHIFFKRIAVAPVLVGQRQPNMDESLDDTLSCPINQICIDDPTIQSNAGPMMMRLIHAELKRRFGSHVVPLDQVDAAYTGIRLNNDKDSPRSLALELAKALPADMVVVGTVWRYRDRGAIEGFPDKPASVAFAIYLVSAETGQRIWRGVYDETQDFALEDMGKFTTRIKMGLKWLTADELARHGVGQAFRPFPKYVQPSPGGEPDPKAGG